VQTDTIPGGADSNGNGLPDAWQRTYFGTLGVDPNADPDGDGMSNKQEYIAGTNPTNSADKLLITDFNTTPGGSNISLTWSSVPTRSYFIQKSLNLSSPNWIDSGLGVFSSSGSSITQSIIDTNSPERFYRVQAIRPLAP